MPGRKGARHMAQRMRISAEKALVQMYARKGGSLDSLQAVWFDLLEREGPKEFLRILSLYCPKELQVEEKTGQIHVVGQVPSNPLEWAKQMQLPEVVTVDQDTGEVIDDGGSAAH